MTPPTPPRPLHRRAGWLAGLPVLALLWAGATIVAVPVVGDALRAQSVALVYETGRDQPEPWLRVEADGRDLLALGEAVDDDSRQAVLGRLAGIPGLRRLWDGTGLVGTVSPFVWSVTRVAPDRLETSGNRPVEVGANALAGLLAPLLPADLTLRDRARAARGGPAGFTAAAAHLVGLLRRFAPGAVASLSDTTLSIRGEALDSAAYEAARASPPEGFRLGDIAVLPPSVEDFHFVVERRPDGGIALSGNVVSEAVRAEAIALSRLVTASAATSARAAGPVSDATRTARGLDPSIDPSALAKAAFRLAGLIRDGAVRFERGSLSVSGTALDEEAVGEAEAAMRDAPRAGIAAGALDLHVRPVSPYTFAVRREAGSVTVTGYLPDRAARESLDSALRQRFLREAIVDRARISSGAPPQWLAAATGALGPLSRLADGEIAVTDRSVRLSGEGLYPEAAARSADELRRALPPGWTAEAAVTTRDAEPAYDTATCVRLFSERVAGHTLRFAPGSTELRPDFYPVLDAVAGLAKACRAERVEVLGHADPAGTPAPKPAVLPEAKAEKDKSDKAKADTSRKPGKAADKAKPASEPAKDPEPVPDLAAARAAAIVDYLLKAGVAPDRALAAQGSAPPADRHGVGLALRS